MQAAALLAAREMLDRSSGGPRVGSEAVAAAIAVAVEGGCSKSDIAMIGGQAAGISSKALGQEMEKALFRAEQTVTACGGDSTTQLTAALAIGVLYGATETEVMKAVLSARKVVGGGESLSKAVVSRSRAITAKRQKAKAAAIKLEESAIKDAALAAGAAVLTAGGSIEEACKASSRAVMKAGGSQVLMQEVAGISAASAAMARGHPHEEVALLSAHAVQAQSP